jgi:O-glycosyl hydrolase
MSSTPNPSPQPQPDALEIATEQAIAACDGDVRATVRALIVANGMLEAELRDMHGAASRGYARGRVKRDQQN